MISVYYTLIPTIAGCTLGGGKHTHDLQTKRGYGPIALGYGIQRGLGGIGRLISRNIRIKLPNVSLFKISSVVINTCVYNERHMQTSKLLDGLVCCSASKNVYRNLSVHLYISFHPSYRLCPSSSYRVTPMLPHCSQ